MSASELPAASAKDLARLRAAMDRPVDTSEIPERMPGKTRAGRAAEGVRVAPPKSAIREAILAELGKRQMTRYRLWKLAQVHCASLPESAVYEFLRGQRQIGLQYVEALIAAMNLTVTAARAKGHARRAS